MTTPTVVTAGRSWPSLQLHRARRVNYRRGGNDLRDNATSTSDGYSPSIRGDARWQVLLNLSWMLGAPPAVLTKNSGQRPLGSIGQDLLSSGCHVT